MLKKVKENQLLVLKESHVHNSGCGGRIELKKNLIVRAMRDQEMDHDGDVYFEIAGGYRHLPLNWFRALKPAEKFYARDRFNSLGYAYVD